MDNSSSLGEDSFEGSFASFLASTRKAHDEFDDNAPATSRGDENTPTQTLLNQPLKDAIIATAGEFTPWPAPHRRHAESDPVAVAPAFRLELSRPKRAAPSPARQKSTGTIGTPRQGGSTTPHMTLHASASSESSSASQSQHDSPSRNLSQPHSQHNSQADSAPTQRGAVQDVVWGTPRGRHLPQPASQLHE